MSVLACVLTAVVSVVFSPDNSVDFGSCRKSSANKLCERRLGKLIATAADRGRHAQQWSDRSDHLRTARSRASVRSSSDRTSWLYPTTSAARIVASFRVSTMTFRHNP